MNKLKELCIGHIEYQTRRCRDCKIEGFNKRCRLYEPVYLEDYDIMEKDIIDIPNKRDVQYEHYGMSCEEYNEEFFKRFKQVGREDENETCI